MAETYFPAVGFIEELNNFSNWDALAYSFNTFLAAYLEPSEEEEWEREPRGGRPSLGRRST